MLALNHLEAGGESKKYNLGNGSGYSIRQIIEAAEKITGKTIKTSQGRRRHGDPPVLISDSALIKGDLGWRPARSDIETIISDAWRWERKWPWKN
jgi:UDP-glucose 4-epimerase